MKIEEREDVERGRGWVKKEKKEKQERESERVRVTCKEVAEVSSVHAWCWDLMSTSLLKF